MLWLLATLNSARAHSLLENAPYLQVLTRPRASPGQIADRGEFRRLLRRSAIFRIGRDDLRVPVAQVGIHSKNAGCFRC